MLRVLLPTVVLLVPALACAADPANGRKLVQEHKCEACHATKAKGGEGAIYLRRNRIVGSLERLSAQVASCKAHFGFALFPEEEADIVAYLNQEYYKFK